MLQQKSTSYLSAKVANCGVVMAEIVGEMSLKKTDIKRLRHQVSVYGKRYYQLMKDGKSEAASSITSDASFSSDD